MKKAKLVALILLASALSAFAQLSVFVDMDPLTPGIQTTRIASPGSMFTVELVLSVGPGGLSSYGISALFDNVELNLNGSPASMEYLPSGFTFNITAGTSGESNTTSGMPGFGHVYTFEAATFGTGPSSSTFAIGSIAFTVPSVLNDGAFDLTPGFFNSGVDGAFDNAGMPISPTFVSSSVIPEPSPFALLALGVAGVVALRRRCRP